MKIKGFDKYRKKLPKFSGKRILIIPLSLMITFLVSLAIQLLFDLLPILLPSTGFLGYLRPWLPVIGDLLMTFTAFFLVFQMWYHRDRLKKKYGQLSYQKIFLVGACGIAVLFSILIHSYIPYYLVKPSFWSQIPFSILATPLTSYIPVLGSYFYFLGLILSVFFFS